MGKRIRNFYEFEDYRIEKTERLLTRRGEVVPLPPKAVELLFVLLENSNHVVTKDELMRRVWTDSFVEEANISRTIFLLRKVFGENGGEKFIETIARRGYRFVAHVAETNGEEAIGMTAHEKTRSHIGFDETYEVEETVPPPDYRILPKVESINSKVQITPAIAPNNLPAEPTKHIRQEKKETIAILPFKNLSGDTASQFYEFSLADAVTTELARLRSLIVRPSSVIAKYQNKEIDAREAGKEMRVNFVLSASFIHSGTRLRVTAQLLDVSTGEIIWSDRIDSDASDVFALQDAITQRILDGLKFDLTTVEKERFGQRPTNNNEAYEEYLRGRDRFVRFIFRSLSPADCNAAIDSFKRAVELDPKFALAWSGLGACYANKVFKAIGDLQDYDFAETAFEKAIALDPNIAEVRVLMGIIYLARGEKKKARAELARVYKQLPNDAAVYFLKALMHRLDGEYDESLRSWDRLERLDPSSAVHACWNRARIYSLQGDNERALKALDCGAVVEPNHPFLKFFRAQILFYKGEVEEATRILKTVLAKNPHLEGIRPLLAMFLAAQDKFAAARKNLSERALKTAYADYDIAYWVASAYALLGENDAAFEWLEHSIKLGMEDSKWLENDKTLNSLRGDKRYIKLLQHIVSQRADKSRAAQQINGCDGETTRDKAHRQR